MAGSTPIWYVYIHLLFCLYTHHPPRKEPTEMIFAALAAQTGFIAVEANTLAHARATMTLRGINWETADVWTAADLVRNDLWEAFTQNLPAGTRVWNADEAPAVV